MAPSASCSFTLVCLRRLEQEVALDGELSISHDRRLLSRLGRDGRLLCHSCDSSRPEFRITRPVAEEVSHCVWQHIPAETRVDMAKSSLSEYPGVSCLVALHKENAALTFCLFMGINSADAVLKDADTKLGTSESLEHGGPLMEWCSEELLGSESPNVIWRHTVPLVLLLRCLPACREHLAGAAAAKAETAAGEDEGTGPAAPDRVQPTRDWFEGEESAIETCQNLRVRIRVAKAETLLLVLDDAVATVLSFSWRGLIATQCFFMQQLSPQGRDPRPVVQFFDVCSCRDFIFAVTPQPQAKLLIWHSSGVAFHAVPLGEYLAEDVDFVSISVARDLLGVALCDSRHKIWVLSLDSYFEQNTRNLDWDLLKERYRCSDGMGIMGQTSKLYQDLTVYPEAFGLRVQEQRKAMSAAEAGLIGRRSAGRSVMDCLVEGVPTYGITLPGGAYGIGDHFLDGLDSRGGREGDGGEKVPAPGLANGTSTANTFGREPGAAAGADGVTRCMPYAWHERIQQTRNEWLDVERPWSFLRLGGEGLGSSAIAGKGSATNTSMANVLNGFSVPAQHRLGDDELNYNLCAAVHRHAQREYKSRLPPWLSKISMPRRAKRFNSPLSSFASSELDGEGSSSGSELLAEDSDEESSHPPPPQRQATQSSGHDLTSLEALRLELERSGVGGPEAQRPRLRHPRRKVRPGRVKLAVTASHVFCEVWEELPRGADDGPWRLVVIPRKGLREQPFGQSWLGGPSPGATDDLSGGLSASVAAAAAAEEAAALQFTAPEVVAFRGSRPWRSLLTQNHIWYLLSEGGALNVLLLNQSPVRVVTNLLIFENRTKAAALCALNGWQPKQLPLLTLFLGLRFRELDEIRQSLGLLRPDQEMQGCQMVMGFIQSGFSCAGLAVPFFPSHDEAQGSAESTTPSAGVPQLPSDRSFISRLLEQAMQHVTRLVQTRVVQIRECNGACRALTYLQPAHAADEPQRYASMVSELSQLTVYMQSLRNIQQQLVRSFGEEAACSNGIVVKCPLRQNADGRLSGLPALDAALMLAAKLQTSSPEVLKDRPAPPLSQLRSVDGAEATVRIALISGRISSALNLFHELKMAEGGSGNVFDEFRATAGRLAYQLVCNQQLDFLFVAMHMLRNVGESVNRFFKAVAFHTSKRLVRQRLLRHLLHMRRLTTEEQSLISLVNLLERLYTNPCYTTEFNRMTTGLSTGQYPQRAHSQSVPPFCSWPAGGRPMLLVGLSCDGALGGHIAGMSGCLAADMRIGNQQYFEQQTSLRELPISQRMPLELYDFSSGYQTPVMAAMLETSNEARKAWASMPCGDVEDLDATPVLGLSNFHKGSNLEQDVRTEQVADLREPDNGEPEGAYEGIMSTARSSCRRCKMEGPQDELDDLPLGLPQGLPEALGLDESGEKSHTMGYLHITLAWMRQWSWETRARIVMEKTHFWPCLVEPLAWLHPPAQAGPPARAWQHCWLDFLVAHQDWRGLAAWVRSLPLSAEDCVDDQGKSCVDLVKLEERGLRCCASYAREVLLQELGHRGIFCSSDAQTFPALLCRLSLCGKLFGEGLPNKGSDDSAAGTERSGGLPGSPRAGMAAADIKEAEGIERNLPSIEGAAGALPLDRLLPLGCDSPFHCFFIRFCIEGDLPALLLLYLQRYDLATTMGTLKELHIRQDERPWASLLLVGRLGNKHLFAASLHHASSVCGSGEPSPAGLLCKDAEGVPFMPLDALAASRPIAFLATLMFAPVSSALELLDSDKDTPWAVSRQTLRKAVAAYPALCETFFPEGYKEGSDGKAESESASNSTPPNYGKSLVEAVAEANCARWTSAEDNLQRLQPKGKPEGVIISVASGAERQFAEKHKAAEDMATFKGDITLSTLLSDVAAFDVDRVLHRLPIFKDEDKEDKALDLADLAAPDEHFSDELDESYFLTQGRAMMAFHVLMTKCKRNLKPGEELRFPLVLAPEDARRLREAAKSVALHNLLNEGVVSSAVCLLELCGLETEKLRVDVEAAKRIYTHTIQRSKVGAGGEADQQRSAAASVIQLFLSFPDSEDASASQAAEAAISSAHLLNALRMLEESTWALDPHPSAPTASSIQALGYDLPWHLVALFCRVHSLPRSLTLLHELARNNDWVMFLYEGDLQQCPAETVLDIVGGYFTEVPLQNHLRILANSIASQEKERQHDKQREEKGKVIGKGMQGDDPIIPADAIGFLERNRFGGGSNGWGLLGHALLHRKARLAVVASAFSDVTVLQCMAVWLTVNAEHSSGAPDSVSSAQPPSPNAAEVAAQIANLCRRRHAFSLVLRALKIFDPDNPLVDFVCFHRAFEQCRFKSCREHLRRFVGRRTECGSYSLEVSPHVEQLSEDMVWYLLDSFPRARMMLLSALDEAGFSPRFSQLFSAFRLIRQTGLDVDFRVPSTELLQLLISKKMFSEARDWARQSGVAGDTVVFEEVTGMIVEFKQGAWWNVLAERLQLWHKCHDAFMRQSSPPAGSANFFLDIASKLEPDLYAREQLVLLSIARELLFMHPAAQDASSHGQAPREEQLEQLKLCLLLILTGTALDLTADLAFRPLDLSYKTIRSLVHRVPENVNALPLSQGLEATLGDGQATKPSFGAAATGKDASSSSSVLAAQQRGPRSELLPFLETAISSLINRDELTLAEQLAAGFGFESTDQKLARTLASVAGGNHREAVRILRSGTHPPPLEPSEGALATAEEGDAEPLLKELESHCSERIALYCRRCMVCYSVSRNIGMDYQEVEKVEATKLLTLLLSPQPYVADFELIRNLITVFLRPLDPAALAEVLASSFVQPMLSQGTMRWAKDKLDEFVSLMSPSQELLGDAALSRIPNFRHRQANLDSAATVAFEGQQVLDLDSEVEVLIMAYHSYVQGCCERSMSELLCFLQSRAELYVKRGHFHSLVRLLFAIPEYHGMEYMFGHLVRHGQLQLLLTEARLWQDTAANARLQNSALAVSLIRYLQVNFPLDLEMLVQVHCCFGLEAELAVLLEGKAGRLAQLIGRKWTTICSEEGEEQLLMCLSMYLQCARLYLKGKRHQRHLVANELAALICLQLKAVQIHLATSLHEQQIAASAGEENIDWAEVPHDGPEALANALVDASGRQKGWSPLGEAQEVSAEPQSPAGAPGATGPLDVQAAELEVKEDRTLAGAGASATPHTETALQKEKVDGSGHTLEQEVAAGPSESVRLAASTAFVENMSSNLGCSERASVAPQSISLGPAGDVFVVINLLPQEVEVFAEYHQDFVATFEVVSAYRHAFGNGLFKVWPRALYRQVVLLGNRLYLQLFMQHLPLSEEWLQAIVQLYIDEPCPELFPTRMLRMKQFLREGVPNIETRYKLARQLGEGFSDVTIEAASLVYMA
eukprot:TRINITY_DN26928_c0_g1_i1.p1 TRINITY_DN26928_c0_g1~~TRINITY_DN26928_c0_g1_i1.p1  ORF type:complete len:3379 (-),score=748.43 TRINITY_DN26928_c0_g1_i1:238-10323(-)